MKKIRIAFMTHTMDNRPGMGTAIVARKTVEFLVGDERFDVTLIHFEKVSDPLYARAREIIMPRVPKFFFGTRFLRFLLLCWRYGGENFDIVHYFQPRLYPFFWLFPARHIIVTAHGGGDALAPQKFSLAKKIFVFIFKHFHHRIDAVIAVSKFGKNEIAAAYGVPLSKIFVVHNGGAEDFVPLYKDAAQERVRKGYGLNFQYILSVSRLVPHKNVEGLIRAYTLARERGISQKLVIVGGRGGGEREVYAAAGCSPYKKDIVFIDYVPQEDLNALYSGADLFVFPSLNEGWGMPIIEAFASGVPVVATNLTAVPEAAGNAALLVDPRDEKALAEAMVRALTDATLRRGLIQKGLNRATQLSWSAMAENIALLYKQVSAKKSA